MRLILLLFIIISTFNLIDAKDQLHIMYEVHLSNNQILETHQIISSQSIEFSLDQTQKLQSFTGYYWVGKKKKKLKEKHLDHSFDGLNSNNAIQKYAYSFPKGKVPDKVEYKYMVVRSEIMSLSSLHFNPDKSYSITIKIPSPYTLTYHLDSPITCNEKTTSTHQWYEFENEKILDDPNGSMVQLLLHPSDESPKNYFQNWYLNLINKPAQLTRASKLKIDGVVKRGVGPKEKAKLLFNYVKDEFNYYGHETSLDIIRPQNVNEVLTSKFGDCKDVALLLYTGYQYLGYESYFGILNLNENLKHTYYLSGFNHAICILKMEDTYLYLDATDKQSRFETINKILNGREILMLSEDAVTTQTISPK